MKIAGSFLCAQLNHAAQNLVNATSSSKPQSTSTTPDGKIVSREVKSLEVDTTRLLDKKVGDFSLGYRWRLMRSLTSGIFCAALNQNTAMSSPFRLIPSKDKNSKSSHQIAQYFSGESVCSENIDAWLKLIPYQSDHHNSDVLQSSKANSSDILRESTDRSALKHLIWRDWLLHSPWHSLTFEANTSNPRAINQNNSKPRGKRSTKRMLKRELSMTLTVSAVLLPKLLPVHADLLIALKEKGYSASKLKKVTGNKAELEEDKGERAVPFDAIDKLVLRRYVRDSRERNFYVEMIIDDPIRSHIPRDHDISAINGNKSGNLEGGGSTVVSVMELLPPFYNIKLNTYEYSIHCPSSTSTRSPTSTYFVADLPSFLYTPRGLKDSDCYFQHLESNTASSSKSKSRPTSCLNSESDDNGERHSGGDQNRNKKREGNGIREADGSGVGQSQSCFGSITWTIDLPHGCSLRSVYRAEKRHMHREQHASDASRGLVVPPAIVTLRSEYNASLYRAQDKVIQKMSCYMRHQMR